MIQIRPLALVLMLVLPAAPRLFAQSEQALRDKFAQIKDDARIFHLEYEGTGHFSLSPQSQESDDAGKKRVSFPEHREFWLQFSKQRYKRRARLSAPVVDLHSQSTSDELEERIDITTMTPEGVLNFIDPEQNPQMRGEESWEYHQGKPGGSAGLAFQEVEELVVFAAFGFVNTESMPRAWIDLDNARISTDGGRITVQISYGQRTCELEYDEQLRVRRTRYQFSDSNYIESRVSDYTQVGGIPVPAQWSYTNVGMGSVINQGELKLVNSSIVDEDGSELFSLEIPSDKIVYSEEHREKMRSTEDGSLEPLHSTGEPELGTGVLVAIIAVGAVAVGLIFYLVMRKRV